jgi:hypothetical protein
MSNFAAPQPVDHRGGNLLGGPLLIIAAAALAGIIPFFSSVSPRGTILNSTSIPGWKWLLNGSKGLFIRAGPP